MKQIQELTSADQLAITGGDYMDLMWAMMWETDNSRFLLFGGSFLNGPSTLLWDPL
jgi:hypothetical protein